MKKQKSLQSACVLWAEPDVLAMDELTNYLDLGSTEALERMMASYPKALILVSHDAVLVRAATSIVWKTHCFANGYDLMVH